MKRIVAVLLLLLLSLLVGCAPHQFAATDGAVMAEMNKEDSRKACYQALAMNGPDYSKLSDMAIVMIEQQKATAQLVGALTGKQIDVCGGGTNLNDVLVADSNNRNRSVQVLGGGVLNAVKWVAGAWAATEIVDSIGKNAGSTSNVDTGGGDSSISNSRTNSETNTDVTNTGEEGTATTSPGIDGTVPAADPVVPGDVEIVNDPIVVTED